MSTLNRSEWSYQKSSSANVSLARLLVSGGMFVLKDPQNNLHRFSYKGFGASLGDTKLLPKGFRLPEIPLPRSALKNGSFSAGGATPRFDGSGAIFYSGNSEPKPEDFEGFTLYAEASIGVLVAGGASLFMTGMREEILVPFLFAPAIFSNYLFTNSAPIVLLYGVSEGLIDSLGRGLMFGKISYNGVYDG